MKGYWMTTICDHTSKFTQIFPSDSPRRCLDALNTNACFWSLGRLWPTLNNGQKCDVSRVAASDGNSMTHWRHTLTVGDGDWALLFSQRAQLSSIFWDVKEKQEKGECSQICWSLELDRVNRSVWMQVTSFCVSMKTKLWLWHLAL